MKLTTSVFVVGLILLAVSPVLAIPATNSIRPTKRPLPTQAVRPSKTEKPNQACLSRLESIKNRSQNLTQFSDQLIKTFDSIATRTQDFYTNKVLPRGKSVSNYTTLVVDIATKKTAAQSALTKAQAVIVDFDCATGDPKTILTDFNQKMKDFKMAINDYKTSVRNLIVGIRSQAPETTPKLTPKVTRLPKIGDQ